MKSWRRSSKWFSSVAVCSALNITLLILASHFLSTNAHLRPLFIALVVFCGCFQLSLGLLCKRYAKRLKSEEDVQRALAAVETRAEEIDADFLMSLSGLPTRFSYKELESITENFTKKLGRGGFGSVYEGILADGSKVAVKRLEKEGRGHKEFCAEVATISRIRHLNLLSLRGFCSDGAHRLLVYELMPRGSLDRWIFNSRDLEADSPKLTLDWKTRFSIALETARGLVYLHEECEERILHLDVKPENILLDGQFRAKVGDFGLSRSMDRDQSRLITTMRGTPGYLAPEWLLSKGIDNKTDVYSYGMVLLELVSGRRSEDQSQDDPQAWYLPAMAFRKLSERKEMELVDAAVRGEVVMDEGYRKQAELSIRVALWCIQEKATRRPAMGEVVRMLERKEAVQEPPESRSFYREEDEEGRPMLSSIAIDLESLITIPR